jgi:HlyD family secretion protein/epimerase transport system membrane fusion protein
MRKDLVPAKQPMFQLPAVGAGAVPATMRRQLWRPILAGCIFIGVFVFGAFAWALAFEISGAVVARSFVRVESHLKSIKHRDGGIIREILVREGQRVEQNQLLVVFDDVQARAQVEVLRNQYYSLVAQAARLEAERDGRKTLVLPEELVKLQSDPAIATLIRDQDNLFKARLKSLEGQTEILNQRLQQLQIRIEGLDAQVTSVDRQSGLIDEELGALTYLFEQGYTTKPRILALQRAAAQLAGSRGQHMSDITRTKEQMGETRLQLAQLENQRQTEAADQYRDAQTRLADVIPRLQAAQEILARTRVLSPASGYVLNLTQFTEGGVAAAGERLMDIVPADAPLVIEARLRPEDVDEVAPGMLARVQLLPYKARLVPIIEGEVTRVSADRKQDPRTGELYFDADVRLKLGQLEKLGEDFRLSPGMPADVMIVIADRTIIAYLLGPFRDSFARALREH